MRWVAIIPARGGSKRIPRKNIKEFCGKPIIAYPIEAALKSGVFDEVMVSTDDEEIAEIARKYGASVPFMRSEATANDFAPLADVTREVLLEYEKRGQYFDYYCLLFSTAALVTPETLRAFMAAVEESGGGGCSFAKFSTPPQRAYAIRNGLAQHIYPEYAMMRTQDLEPLYYDAGQFSSTKVSVFLGREEWNGKSVPFVLPEEELQDVDNECDWLLAELKYKLRQENLQKEG